MRDASRNCLRCAHVRDASIPKTPWTVAEWGETALVCSAYPRVSLWRRLFPRLAYDTRTGEPHPQPGPRACDEITDRGRRHCRRFKRREEASP